MHADLRLLLSGKDTLMTVTGTGAYDTLQWWFLATTFLAGLVSNSSRRAVLLFQQIACSVQG